MKKILSILLIAAALFGLCACRERLIRRGRWENGVYYNDYGGFKIVTNDYFEIYPDKKIKENMGAVYPSDRVLNDMIISSDYCAIIVTLEYPGTSYSQEEYVEQFVLNTRRNSVNGTYDLAEPFTQTVADKPFTCVAVRYAVPSASGDMAYFEYDFIYKTESGVFVILRVTAGTEALIYTALGAVQSF